MCRLSGNSRDSTSWNPKGLSRPVAGKLYLFTCSLFRYQQRSLVDMPFSRLCPFSANIELFSECKDSYGNCVCWVVALLECGEAVFLRHQVPKSVKGYILRSRFSLWATGWTVQDSNHGRDKRGFSSPKRIDWLWGRQPSHWFWGSFMGVKRPGRDADHSPASIAEAEKKWTNTSAPSRYLHGVHRNNFALTFFP
jgi:hypothetical protein